MRRLIKFSVTFLIAILFISYVVRPLPIPKSFLVKPGISYERIVKYVFPFRIIHVVRIDLTNKSIHFLVTPPNIFPGEDVELGDGFIGELKAQTTSEFAEKNKTTVAINGGLFFPFEDTSPFSFKPIEGDSVDIHGETISNGRIISSSQHGWPVLCIGENNEISFPSDFKCPNNTWNAISGKYPLIQNGNILASGAGEADRAPRTAVGINRRSQLVMVIVDGRQPLYSGGVTSQELASELSSLDLVDALELDGGGSSTLVINNGNGQKIMNSPIHTRIPLRERPVASHLGVVWKD